jgi:hypothetical protein
MRGSILRGTPHSDIDSDPTNDVIEAAASINLWILGLSLAQGGGMSPCLNDFTYKTLSKVTAQHRSKEPCKYYIFSRRTVIQSNGFFPFVAPELFTVFPDLLTTMSVGHWVAPVSFTAPW